MSPATTAVRRLAVAAAAVAVASGGLGPATASAAPAAHTAQATAGKPLGYTPVGPVRLLDTRTSPTIHSRGPASIATLKVTGVGGVPATGVEAVALNVTAIATTHSTFITVYPAGSTRPTASNLNVALKRTRANEVIAQVGAGGAISFYNASGLTDVLVDVSGWFATGSSYTGRSPVRILDTRNGGATPRPAASVTVVRVTGVASVPTTGVSAVVLNLTGISAGGGTFVTAYPTGSSRPATSNLNLAAAQTAAIMVVATPSAGGQITLYNSGGPTHLLVDVAGWFTGTNDYHPLTPARLLDSRISGGFTAGNTQWPVQISGRGNVPSTANAAIVTVTVVQPAAGGHVTAFPFGAKDPGTSTVNVRTGETTANLAIVSLSADGRIAVLVHDKAQRGILVDIVGWIDATPALLAGPPAVVPVAQVGQPYALQLVASGGYPPYTWTAAAGALPAGLSLSPSGLISGTPTMVDFARAVTVTDGAGQSVVVDPLDPLMRVTTFLSRDVWAWGTDSATLPHLNLTPTSLPALAGTRRIATGQSSCDTTYAVDGSGQVWAWGAGTFGALGDGTSTDAPPDHPVQVSGLTDVVSVAGHDCGGYALKSDGTVWAWGSDNGNAGTLGGTTSPTFTTVPIQVPGLTDMTALASSSQNGYAIKSDGTLWAWGDNAAGELGIGTGDQTSGVVQVPGLSDVSAVTGGARTAYARTGSGALYAWGENSNGQVGVGSANPTPVPTPTQVTISGNVTSIGAGAQTGYAVTSDGKAWAWGAGGDGELGNGANSDSSVPVAVSGLSSVTTITGAKGTGLALLSDGTVWSWGAATFKLLGRGAGTQPTNVPGFVPTPKATQLVTHADGTEVYVIGVP